MTDRQGPLIIIGGHEDKKGDKLILKAVAECIGEGKLVIATVASHEPEGYFDSYRAAFADLGVTNLTELYVNERVETLKEETADPLRDAAGVRSEEHTSELQSLMRNSYAVFCLQKKKQKKQKSLQKTKVQS